MYSWKNSSWWINIKLSINIKTLKNADNYYKISDNIGLKFINKNNFSYNIKQDTELNYIIKGIFIIKDKLDNYINNNGIVIEIENIAYNFCDYQEEGLSVAIIKLMSEIYGFEMPNIPVHFNKQLNKYIFEF